MINTLDTSINLESITKSSTIIILALQYLEKISLLAASIQQLSI